MAAVRQPTVYARPVATAATANTTRRVAPMPARRAAPALSVLAARHSHAQMARRGGVVMHAKKGKKAVEEVVEEEEEDEFEEVEEEVEVEVEEEVEETTLVEKEVVVDRPVQGMITSVQAAAPGLWAKPAVRNGAVMAGAVLGATLLWSVYQVVKKYRTPKAKRKRTVGKNMRVVLALEEYLPDNLSIKSVEKVRGETGFKPEEIFRKYLRWALDQRAFDPATVSDLLNLARCCVLTDDQIAELLEESAKRTFDRTGILMRKPSGFTAEGLQKKATGRALFSKLMYLADLEQLLPSDKGQDLMLRIMEIFGATEEDFNELRITSLSEADTERLDALMGRGQGEGAAAESMDESMDEGTAEGTTEPPAEPKSQ